MRAVVIDLDHLRRRKLHRQVEAGQVCALCETSGTVVISATSDWRYVVCATCSADNTVATPGPERPAA